MSLGLIYHNDLDGLISAMILIKSNEFEIDKVFDVDYGHDHSHIKQECDQFIIVDYAENITEEKTALWIDHHLREDMSDCKDHILKEAPSCVDLIINKLKVGKDLLGKEDLWAINCIDSASYDFNKVTPEDILFPDTETKLGKYIAINQLLMKNRKRNVCRLLLENLEMDPDVMLYTIKNIGGKVIDLESYLEHKIKLVEKISSSKEEYIEIINGIPVVITKGFSQTDWRGYDRNIFYYLLQEYPFVIVTYQMGGSFSFQVAKNLFCLKDSLDDLSNMLKDFENLRGHHNILNFSYNNKSEGLEALDTIIEHIHECV